MKPNLRTNLGRFLLGAVLLLAAGTVRVPLFINTGDKIRVDTRTREYYERIK